MPAKIIHVGKDACHRVGVLESAGFLVEECTSTIELCEALDSDESPDAVAFTEDQGQFSQRALALVRAHVDLPLILFGDPQISFADSTFDLVIPCLALPDAWLTEIAALVAHRQALCVRTRMPVKRVAACPPTDLLKRNVR